MASPSRNTLWPLAALCAVFVASGWPFMKKLGIEVDEALIGNGIYPGLSPWYSWHWFGSEIPVMLMTYLGAFKTWLYAGLFAIWQPGPLSLRIPMMLVGALTIVLFFVFADRAAGRRAAWIGAALLATDPSFVLTESIDLGFVALQHAFKLGGLLLLMAFHRRPTPARLAGAFFLFGLALWDKAVFAWILAALAVAGAAVFWRELRRHMSARNVAVATIAFAGGAFPFIVYNIGHPLETFTTNAHLMPDNPVVKLVLTKRTVDGSGLFGFVTAPDTGPRPPEPRGLTQRAAFALSRWTGAPTTNWTGWAFALALTGVPFVWRTPARRPLAFALCFLAAGWLQMFFTSGAGGAVHHIVLLWPFHLFAIAVVLSTLAAPLGRRSIPAIAAVAAVLCAANILVVNQYYVALVRNGSGTRWTDAFAPLEAWLYQAKMAHIDISDWGIVETLNLMSEGELPLQDASYALRSFGDTRTREWLARVLEQDDSVWVSHSPVAEQWLGTETALIHFAESLGYSQEPLHIVHDRNGRPIFEIFRFRHGK